MKSFKRKPRWHVHLWFNRKVRFNFSRSWSLKEPNWKDKFKTPRCEIVPSITIEFFWIGIYIYRGDDDYWERWLWIHIYNDGDEDKARDNWGWVDMDSEESTWFKNY